MNSKKEGFTLIELLVVVLIIGVLAAIAVPQYQKAVLKSRFSSLMPSTRAVRDGNELYYMTQNRYASNMSDLDVKVASNDESTIQVKNDGDYIYTIATAPKLKNNLVMYQKHSGKFAGEIHCEADKDDAQAIWLCSQGLHGVEKDGSLTPNYKTYILEGAGTDNFGSAASGRTITGYYNDHGEEALKELCGVTDFDTDENVDWACVKLASEGPVLLYSDGSMMMADEIQVDEEGYITQAMLTFYDPSTGELGYNVFFGGQWVSASSTYDGGNENLQELAEGGSLLNAEYEAGNVRESTVETEYPDEAAYILSHYEEWF